MACSCATDARSASSGPSPSYLVISSASQTRCRCTSRFSTTTMPLRHRLRSRPSSRSWRLLRWASRPCWSGALATPVSRACTRSGLVRIQIQNLQKRFGSTLVLDNIDLEIREREFLGLLGPSGSGKTTLLRILAGLEFADEGRILFDGQDALMLPIKRRQVGMVFQHYALFGHMTVARNVAFGLEVRSRERRPSRAEIAERVQRLLQLVQLEGFGHRFPGQLSGGQRQRV